MEINFVGINELDRLIDGLSDSEKEELTARLFKKLSLDARSRILGLSESGLSIITGNVVNLNAEVAINIQNSSELDAEKIVRALFDFRHQSKN